MSSRLRRAGSGKTKVSAIPATETPAVSSSVPRSPKDDDSTGNKNTPMNAPNLPIPAEIPCPVARMATGYSSLGITNVVMFGPNSVKK
jgi:hypothetical protein